MKQLITLTAVILTSIFSYSQTKVQDSLTIQLAYQKQDSAKVETSIQLIKVLYDSKEFKKALLYINQSEQLSASLNYYSASAELKYYKALIYTENNDYYNALDNYNRSLNLFTQLKDSLGMAKVNNSLGLVEIRRGNYNKGLRHSLSAIDVFERKNLLDQLSLAYNNLAEAYFNTNQNDEALNYNFKALRVRELLKDTDGIKASTNNIAKLYALNKEHRKSIEYYEKLLTYLTNSESDKIIEGEVLPNIGEQYLQFRDYTKAASYLLEGLKLNRANNNKKGILKTLNNLSDLNLQQNKIRLAEYQLNEAYKLTEEVEDDDILLKHLKLRVQLDSTKGNYKNAFNWQREYHDLKAKIDKTNAIPVVFDDPYDVINNSKTAPTENITANINDKTLKQYKYLSYGLGALLLISIIALLSVFFKRKTLGDTLETLKDKNKQYRLENDSLLEQTIHLEEMNNVKDRLFSIVSHDLKDSITGVKAFLDLLKEDSISREEFDELIPELSENADNAAALLMNLLNWSKSQMQNLEPKPQQFNIQDVFSEKMNLIEKKVSKKQIILLDESIKDYVYADRSMVEIIIQNLLANAVKFSRIGDVITISNRERNGNILICIEDTGVGISKENQEKLFTNSGFTTRGTSHEKGTGLGLSIVKQLVEINHGKIWVESEPNLGSKFFVELPKAKAIS
ncbi:MAG: ATP-binding protein [Bacteroidetes bacterium]|nr:MAG: ATP-binding protein [Bacteroidota bacterium]